MSRRISCLCSGLRFQPCLEVARSACDLSWYSRLCTRKVRGSNIRRDSDYPVDIHEFAQACQVFASMLPLLSLDNFLPDDVQFMTYHRRYIVLGSDVLTWNTIRKLLAVALSDFSSLFKIVLGLSSMKGFPNWLHILQKDERRHYY
jgi:hypothetical protein